MKQTLEIIQHSLRDRGITAFDVPKNTQFLHVSQDIHGKTVLHCLADRSKKGNIVWRKVKSLPSIERTHLPPDATKYTFLGGTTDRQGMTTLYFLDNQEYDANLEPITPQEAFERKFHVEPTVPEDDHDLWNLGRDTPEPPQAIFRSFGKTKTDPMNYTAVLNSHATSYASDVLWQFEKWWYHVERAIRNLGFKGRLDPFLSVKWFLRGLSSKAAADAYYQLTQEAEAFYSKPENQILGATSDDPYQAHTTRTSQEGEAGQTKAAAPPEECLNPEKKPCTWPKCHCYSNP